MNDAVTFESVRWWFLESWEEPGRSDTKEKPTKHASTSTCNNHDKPLRLWIAWTKVFEKSKSWYHAHVPNTAVLAAAVGSRQNMIGLSHLRQQSRKHVTIHDFPAIQSSMRTISGQHMGGRSNHLLLILIARIRMAPQMIDYHMVRKTLTCFAKMHYHHDAITRGFCNGIESLDGFFLRLLLSTNHASTSYLRWNIMHHHDGYGKAAQLWCWGKQRRSFVDLLPRVGICNCVMAPILGQAHSKL